MQKSETVFVIIRIDSQKDMHILEVFNIVLLFFQCILVSGSGWLCPRPCDSQRRRKDWPEPSESSYAYRAQRKVGSAYDMVPHVSGHGESLCCWTIEPAPNGATRGREAC